MTKQSRTQRQNQSSQAAKTFARFGVLFLLSLWWGMPSAAAAEKGNVKKKVVYRSHTQIDLSGETVQGKIRAPEVFYVFQRKRSEAHHVVKTPINLDYHDDAVAETLRKELPR